MKRKKDRLFDRDSGLHQFDQGVCITSRLVVENAKVKLAYGDSIRSGIPSQAEFVHARQHCRFLRAERPASRLIPIAHSCPSASSPLEPAPDIKLAPPHG